MPSLHEVIGSFTPVSSAYGILPGTVVSFNYQLFKRDPYPIIILLRDEGEMLFGLNLHYLTFPTTQKIFRQFGQAITYDAVKNVPNIQHAFRRYKKSAILQPRIQELSEILRRMMIPRVYPEHEIAQAREQFRAQAEEAPTEEV